MQVHWNRERLEFLLHWLPVMKNEVESGEMEDSEYMALYNEMLSLSKEFTNGN